MTRIIEFGHRTRLGTGKYVKYRPKGTTRFVPGVFMLKAMFKNSGENYIFLVHKINQLIYYELNRK